MTIIQSKIDVGIDKFPSWQTFHIYCEHLCTTKNWIKKSYKKQVKSFSSVHNKAKVMGESYWPLL